MLCSYIPTVQINFFHSSRKRVTSMSCMKKSGIILISNINTSHFPFIQSSFGGLLCLSGGEWGASLMQYYSSSDGSVLQMSICRMRSDDTRQCMSCAWWRIVRIVVYLRWALWCAQNSRSVASQRRSVRQSCRSRWSGNINPGILFFPFCASILKPNFHLCLC